MKNTYFKTKCIKNCYQPGIEDRRGEQLKPHPPASSQDGWWTPPPLRLNSVKKTTNVMKHGSKQDFLFFRTVILTVAFYRVGEGQQRSKLHFVLITRNRQQRRPSQLLWVNLTTNTQSEVKSEKINIHQVRYYWLKVSSDFLSDGEKMLKHLLCLSSSS